MYLPLQEMRARFINSIAHIAGWIIFFSLVLGFVTRSPGGQSISKNVLALPFLSFCAIFLFLFYFNTYLLIPKLYLEKKYILYFTFVLILFAAVYILKPFDGLMGYFSGAGIDMNPPGPPPGGPGRPPGEHRPRHIDITSIILFVTVWSLSSAICIVRQLRTTEQRAIRAEADKTTAELSFLKAQINPHFLFNTLNNIYSLAVTKNENTAASILKLSNIMRYVTDEIRADYVSLQYEADCINDYIDLQRMRLGKNMNVNFSVSGDTGNKTIAPLLLMTFVENVFKYGISNREQSEITIRLAVEEHSITFYSRNRLYDARPAPERTGIGIANARQRLEHLYRDKYFLHIDTGNGYFTVQLTLQV